MCVCVGALPHASDLSSRGTHCSAQALGACTRRAEKQLPDMKQERERKRRPPYPLTLKTTPRAWPPVPPYIDLNVLASWMCVSGLRSASVYDSAFRLRTCPDHPRQKKHPFSNLLILINLIVKTQIRAKSAHFRANKLVLTQRGCVALFF